MAKFPEPPAIAVLAAFEPKYQVLPLSTIVTRIFFAGGPHPTHWDAFRYFGPTASRFDSTF